MKRLWVKKRRKRQKRCCSKGRQKDRRHGYEEKVLKVGEDCELWENEHTDRHCGHNYNKGQ